LAAKKQNGRPEAARSFHIGSSPDSIALPRSPFELKRRMTPTPLLLSEPTTA
jgi:hypothetical protein